MHCPVCNTVYGGPTMAAFACCPRCLAEDQRIELLLYSDEPPAVAEPFDAPRSPLRRARRGPDVGVDVDLEARRAYLN